MQPLAAADTAATADEYVPGVHPALTHTVAATAPEKRPAGQATHGVAGSMSSSNSPGWHALHELPDSPSHSDPKVQHSAGETSVPLKQLVGRTRPSEQVVVQLLSCTRAQES